METTGCRPWMGRIFSFCVLLALIELSLAQSASSTIGIDQNISNGTCYYAQNEIADGTYIPCGNAAYKHYTCCEAKSNCLGHNACYSYDGTTYLAGCTDPAYMDPTCPDKTPYDSQQWSGLVYCNGTSNEWTHCDDSSGQSNTVLGPGPACWCPEDPASRLVAFSAPASLVPIALLPATLGSSISYYDGFGPDGASTTNFAATTSVASSASDSTTLSMSSTSVVPTRTITPPSPPPSSGLSSGVKAGIGVGAAAGGIITLALLWLLALFIGRRRQRKRSPEDANIRPRSQALAAVTLPSDNDDPRSPAWSGNKSELPSEERNSALIVSPGSMQGQWRNRPTSAEVEGSMPAYHSMTSLRSQALQNESTVYQPYRRAVVPPVGVQEVTGSSEKAEATYGLGRAVGDAGVYEMPAQVPGSTLR